MWSNFFVNPQRSLLHHFWGRSGEWDYACKTLYSHIYSFPNEVSHTSFHLTAVCACVWRIRLYLAVTQNSVQLWEVHLFIDLKSLTSIFLPGLEQKIPSLINRIVLFVHTQHRYWKSCLNTQHSKNEDHSIWSHYFMASRWEKSGTSDRFYLLGLRNHWRWWLQPWN